MSIAAIQHIPSSACFTFSNRFLASWCTKGLRASVRFLTGARDYIHSKTWISVLRSIQPHFQWVLGILSSEVKRPGCEAKHLQLAPRSKWWSYNSNSHTSSWNSVQLIRHTDNLFFLLLCRCL
jgi:hypothetical protein